MAQFEAFGVKFEFESAEARAKIISLLGDYKALKKELESATDLVAIKQIAQSVDATAKKLKDLGVEVTSTKSKIDSFSKSSSEAQYALVNLSRIAQDAPYGFIGIANNLNPALESFQRLGEKSKESGGALKALGQALIGPAGVGLALGIVSSLIVKYGDAMMEIVNQTTELEKAQKGVRDAFIDNVKNVETTIVKDEALVSVINNTNLSLDTRKNALIELKEAHKGNIELQKTDIEDGGKLLEIINKISEALLRKAQIEAFSKIIAEEQAKLIKLQTADTKEQIDNLSNWTKTWNALAGTLASAGGLGAAENTQLNNTKNALEETTIKSVKLMNAIDKLKNSFKDLIKESSEKGDYGTLSTSTGKKGEKTDLQKFAEATDLFNTQVKNNLEVLKAGSESSAQYYDNYLNILKSYLSKISGLKNNEAVEALKKLTPKELIKQTQDESFESEMAAEDARQNRALGIDKIGDAKTTGTKGLFGDDTDFNKAASKTQFQEGQKEYQKMRDKQKADLKEQQQAYKNFANTIANDVTGAFMKLYQVMSQGGNILDALGSMFEELAIKIAEAAIKAAVFTFILSLLPGGAGLASQAGSDASGSSGGFLGVFKKLLGFADGGIVSRPTLAMVGEGGESEAIMPLSKLGNLVNNSFNAGTNYGGGGSQNGQFVLRGNDLVLAMQRSNYSLNLRRGS